MLLLSFEDFPKDIAEALKRANAWQKLDEPTNTLYITSRNKEQPLTNSEKIRICKYLVMKKHKYRRVVFEKTPIPGYVEKQAMMKGEE